MTKKHSSLRLLTVLNLSAFIALHLLTPNAKAAVSVSPFPDVQFDSPYATAITYLKDKGVVTGYPDKLFRPTQMVSRVEAIKMIYAAVFKHWENEEGGGGAVLTDDQIPLKDVDKKAWYWPYLVQAYSDNVATGYADHFFHPTSIVNKAEVSKMLLTRYYKSNPDYAKIIENPYSDVPQTAWFAAFAADVKAKNILYAPFHTETFSPGLNVSRQELADLIYRLMSMDDRNLNRFIKEGSQNFAFQSDPYLFQMELPADWGKQDYFFSNGKESYSIITGKGQIDCQKCSKEVDVKNEINNEFAATSGVQVTIYHDPNNTTLGCKGGCDGPIPDAQTLIQVTGGDVKTGQFVFQILTNAPALTKDMNFALRSLSWVTLTHGDLPKLADAQEFVNQNIDYPSSWGVLTESTSVGETGESTQYAFSNKKDVYLTLTTADFSVGAELPEEIFAPQNDSTTCDSLKKYNPDNLPEGGKFKTIDQCQETFLDLAGPKIVTFHLPGSPSTPFDFGDRYMGLLYGATKKYPYIAMTANRHSAVTPEMVTSILRSIY